MIVRVPLDYSPGSGFFVKLPTYLMVPGSFAPVIPGVIGPDGVVAGVDPAAVLSIGVSVECEVPDADCNPETRAPCPVAINRRYPGAAPRAVPPTVPALALDAEETALFAAELAPGARPAEPAAEPAPFEIR